MRIFLASLFFSTFVSKRMTNRTMTIVLEIKSNFPEQPRLGFKPQTNFSGFEWLRKHELVVEISRTLKQNSSVHHQRDFITLTARMKSAFDSHTTERKHTNLSDVMGDKFNKDTIERKKEKKANVDLESTEWQTFCETRFARLGYWY